MVLLSRITTKAGDGGETGLGDGSRTPKDSPRIEAIGAVDECNAAIGLCRAHCSETEGDLARLLMQIQNDLFDLGSDLCRPSPAGFFDPANRFAASRIEWLELQIATLNQRLEPLRSFVLPGGNPLSAHLHLARTIVRRSERRVFTLARAETINPNLAPYLNRLSDLLFVASRIAEPEGKLWTPGRDV
ncbi:MAG: cob(I)yrinic acid a,c-diamide adenosyltransferase [Alphaproteobacteria bacterium]|nr:cob(I)yrinic acid a,c-diamide adenosyltransferase [Alphaproteobacteria bacterium]